MDVDELPVDSVGRVAHLELSGLAHCGEGDQGGALGDGDLLHAPHQPVLPIELVCNVLELFVQVRDGEVLGHVRQIGHLHCVSSLQIMRCRCL